MALRCLQPTVYVERFSAMRLWRDDVAEMVGILEEALPGDAFTLSSPGYSLDSIEDLAEFPSERISELHIAANKSDLTLTISAHESYISVTQPTLQVRGAVNEIAKIAHRCKRSWLARLFYREGSASSGLPARLVAALSLIPMAIAAVIALTASKGGILPTDQELLGTTSGWSALGFSGLGLLLVLTLGIRDARTQTLMYTKTRIEAPTFYSRKKDDLKLTVISNAVSLIAGGAIGYWINTIS